jgi:GNAT superfamily N-acetyltransferase
LALEAQSRNGGIGQALHAHVEHWLAQQGVHFLQVKTIAASSPSKEYAETRAFYLAIGYEPLEEFPLLWEPRLPVLQLVKALPNAA